MAQLSFAFTTKANGVLIRHKPGLLRKQLPSDKWVSAANAAQANALGRLKVTAGTTEEEPAPVRFEADHLFLSHDAVANLSRADANLLDLPPDSPFALRIKARDHVMSDGFHLDSRWVHSGGMGVAVKVQGAFIHKGGRMYRIPGPAFSIYRAAKALQNPMQEAERHLKYAALKEALAAHIGDDVEVDEFISSVTIYHAGAFSLNLGVYIDDFDFEPVLFSRDVADDADNGPVSEQASALLPPKLQNVFAKQRFQQFADARAAYPLERGSFVIIDPALRKPLQEMRRIAGSDASVGRQTVCNLSSFSLPRFTFSSMSFADLVQM